MRDRLEKLRQFLRNSTPDTTDCHSPFLAGAGLSEYRIPDSWRNNEFLEDGVYYLIPGSLRKLVLQELGRERFSSRDLEREDELGKSAREDYGEIAIRNGGFVTYSDLCRFRSISFNADEAKFLGLNPVDASEKARIATERLYAVDGPRRGYLGWLLTDRMFLDEHDALLRAHGVKIREYGFPQPILSPGQIDDVPTAEEVDWVASCRRFYARWRLQSMALPYLPRPLAYLVPNPLVPSLGIDEAGTLNASIPDIYPTLGRGTLGDMIEESLRIKNGSEHLMEWFKIVQKSNTAKKVIPTFERWFRLQHYWRLLYRRYPEQLHRKKEALAQAFASYFEVSDATVKSDLRRISSLLGTGWELRFAELP